jgi:hypothetical protein
LHKVGRNEPDIAIPRSMKQRKLHKAFLRYHDPKNWPMLRDALKAMGRADLIGNGKQHLIPAYQPKGLQNPLDQQQAKRQVFKTKHTQSSKASRQR